MMCFNIVKSTVKKIKPGKGIVLFKWRAMGKI